MNLYQNDEQRQVWRRRETAHHPKHLSNTVEAVLSHGCKGNPGVSQGQAEKQGRSSRTSQWILDFIQLLRTMCIIQTLNEPKCDRYKITHAHTALLTLLFMILFACRIV